jgi:SAM-dependent methyltransferase
VAVDLETHWIEPLAGDVVEVRRGDFGELELEPGSFDLIVAQMLLLHLPDPRAACRRFIELAKPGGRIVIHDSDFSPLELARATPDEAAGIAVMPEVMTAAGIDLSLGPKVAGMLEAAGAEVEHVEERPSATAADRETAAEITAITIERFRDRARGQGAAIDAALSALRERGGALTGPTRWVIRARVPASA